VGELCLGQCTEAVCSVVTAAIVVSLVVGVCTVAALLRWMAQNEPRERLVLLRVHPARAAWLSRQRRLGNAVGDAGEDAERPDEEGRPLVGCAVEMAHLGTSDGTPNGLKPRLDDAAASGRRAGRGRASRGRSDTRDREPLPTWHAVEPGRT
jgi:hypothetical protein